MHILITAIPIGLLLLTVVARASWARSAWLVDRNLSLERVDRFVEDLNTLSEFFPKVSSDLDLPRLNEAWAVQRAEIVTESGFFHWFKNGRPLETVDSPRSGLLFSFARSQAQPLSYSIGLVEATEPSSVLIDRIKAVVDQRTGRLLLDRRFVRLSPAPKQTAAAT